MTLSKPLPRIDLDETAAPAAWEDLWHGLYQREFDAIYRLLLHLGVASADAEDVVQKVFLVAWRQLKGDKDVAYPKAWLRGIAVRSASDYRRWRHVRVAKNWLLRSGEQEVDDESPELRAEQRELRRDVLLVLDGLSSKLRQVLVLSDLEGCATEDIARALAISPNTVRSRKRLAREKFKRLWERHEKAVLP